MKAKSANINRQWELVVQEIVQRAENGKLNVREFAQMTGFDRRHVAEVLKGERHDLDILDSLAYHFNLKSIKITLTNE